MRAEELNPLTIARRRENCRACGGEIHLVFDLGAQFLQGAFVKPGKPPPPHVRFPLELARCGTCGLAQLRHTVPSDLMYRTYWYRSRINDTMRAHFAWLADRATGMLGRAPRRVLDIGCNDGSMLARLRPAECWGVDPSDAVGDVPPGLHVINDFFPTRHEALRPGSFDLVLSIAMFYDVERPVEFASRVAELLAPGGVWVVEVGYLPTMLRNGGYDAICHEHLEYYSLGTLERIFHEAGLEVASARLTPTNGGSLCCFVTHATPGRGDAPGEDVAAIRASEAAMGLDTAAPFEAFAKRVTEHRDRLRDMLLGLRDDGRTVHVYGASTRGNTILQFCGIDRSVVALAAERNPDKVGARTLGTDIEIISEEQSRRLRPDYYLVLPWHFRDEIVAREADTRRRGCGLIFPLPELEIVR